MGTLAVGVYANDEQESLQTSGGSIEATQTSSHGSFTNTGLSQHSRPEVTRVDKLLRKVQQSRVETSDATSESTVDQMGDKQVSKV